MNEVTKNANTKIIVQYPKKCCEKTSNSIPPVKIPESPAIDIGIKMLTINTEIITAGIVNPSILK